MTTIAGADIVVQTDLGIVPFILNRDHLDTDVLTPREDAWSSITCDVSSAAWSWGATQPLGPLTEVDGGRARLSLIDPDRLYDPSNDSSPYAGVLSVGLPLRVLIDGSPAWTGTLEEWRHDLGSLVSTLTGIDPIGSLAARVLPKGTPIPAGATAAQAQAVLDAAGWPVAGRVFSGGSAATRTADSADGSALDALAGVRFAEHARLFATRDGSIGWRGRAVDYAPPASAVINCGGAGLGELGSVFARGRVRNVVLIDGDTPGRYEIPESERRHGPRYVKTSTADLLFAAGSLLELPDAPAVTPQAAPRVAPTSQTIVADRSSLLAQSPSGTGLGGGQDLHLPCGTSGGYRLRDVIGFPAPDWSGISALVSATLRLKTSDYAHLTPGSSPRITVRRVTEAWSPNGAAETWTTAAEAYPGPSVTDTGSVSPSITTAQNATVDIDVTALIRPIAPPAAGGSGAKWYGVKLYPYAEDSASRNCEFWSAERPSADRPRLILTLSAGHPPDAPTLVSPQGDSAAATSFVFRCTDPDGDPIASWHAQLRNASGAITWTSADGAGSIAADGSTVTVPYTGPALTAQRYSWTAQAKDATAWGAWAPAATFTPGALPPTPWKWWSQIILDALGEPAILTDLGTIIPQGPDVAAVACAEFGDRWQVVDTHTSPAIDRLVRVLGESVSITPDSITVDATTEDV